MAEEIGCYEAGCTSLYTMAEYLDITADYLKDACNNKYGTFAEYENYILFILLPALGC